MMKKILVVLILIVPFAARASVFTLQQCIDTAYTNSLTLQNQQLAGQRSLLALRQAWYNISPNVSGYIDQSWSFGRSTGVDNINRAQNIANTGIGLSANMILFDGLAMKFNIDEAKANKLASDANLEAVQRNVALTITSLYLNVLLQKELRDVAQAQLEETGRQVERVRAKVEAERQPVGDLYEIQAQHAKEQYALVQRQNDVRLALLDLSQAMNIPFDEDFDIIQPAEEELDGPLLPERQEVWQTALTHRPEIRGAQYTLEAEQTALKRQKSAYSPTLSAGAGVSTGYYHLYGNDNTAFGKQLSENLTTHVSLNLSIPIYNQMRTPTQVKQQKIAIESAELELEQTKKDIQQEIDQAYYNALAAQSEKVSARQAEQSSAEAARYATEKYTAGRSNAYEYGQATQQLLSARSTFLRARYNYLFKVRILEYYMGL